MVQRFGILFAAAMAVLPIAAGAEGVDFTAPDGYMVAVPPSSGGLPAVYRVWDRTIDGARHSIVVSASVPSGDLPAIVDAAITEVTGRNAIDVSHADAAPMCGAPSARVAYSYANRLTFVYRYAIVAGRLLVASYAHPVGTEADPSALAALDTLCTGIHQPGGPKGWSVVTPLPGNRSAWRPAPGSSALIAQTMRPTVPGRASDDGLAKSGGSDVSDRFESCGVVKIHRVTTKFDDGRTIEFASGTVRGYDYIVSYARPTSTTADPGAMETLTSFCTDTAPR